MRYASSASVFSSRTATSATLALNAAECVLRGLLLLLAPVFSGEILALRSSVNPHRAVQFCGASSDRPVRSRPTMKAVLMLVLCSTMDETLLSVHASART